MSGTRFDLRGRVVVITGAARGIGKVYARAFAEAGMRVVIADIHEDDAGALAGELVGDGREALAVRVDISDERAVKALASKTADTFGGIDALVNNASLMSTLPRRSWREIPLEEWDQVMAVDLRGLFLCCHAVYPYLRERGKGKIVNVSSGRVLEGTPNRLHYTTAKAGVIGFTRALAREVGNDNITVNAVMPGLTLSETQISSSSQSYLSGDYDRLRAIQRPQYPDDLVGTVMYLLSDASDFVTGQSINVDGGRMMH